MSAKKITKDGTVVVRPSTESMFDGPTSFIVRDDRFAEVAQGTLGTPMSLPPGLYSVETLASSGARLSELVRVEEGAVAEVMLAEPNLTRAVRIRPAGTSRSRRGAVGGRKVGDRLMRAEAVELGDGNVGFAAEAPAVELEDEPEPAVTIDIGQGWISATTTDTGWRFVPEAELDVVPWVRVRRGEKAWDVSLPMNPAGYGVTRECTIDVLDVPMGSTATPFVVGIPPERGVAHFIEGQLMRNTLSSDTSVLEEATRLLRSKYDDPAAAALAGLTLNRLGLLLERADWVENLASDFPWLADARILMAALLRHDHQRIERDRGLEMLLTVARERPLYADGLSLALELLQRWPDLAGTDEHRAAIEKLGSLAAYTDWTSVSLVTRVP